MLFGYQIRHLYAPPDEGHSGFNPPKPPLSSSETVSVFDFQVSFKIPEGFTEVSLTEYGFDIFEDGPFKGWANDKKDILFSFGRGLKDDVTNTALSMSQYNKFTDRDGTISDVAIHPISEKDGLQGASTTFWGVDTDGQVITHTKLVLGNKTHWISLEATHSNARTPEERHKFISEMAELFQTIQVL